MNRVAAMVSVGVFVVGVLLLYGYKRNLEAEISGGDRVPVLVATSTISMGSIIQEGDLGVRDVPEAYLEPRHILASDSRQVIGARVANGVEANESLLWSDLHVARNGRNLSGAIQMGKRAITIAGEQGTLHGLLRPGDRVDLLLTTDRVSEVVSFPLLQNLLVLAVGHDVGEELFDAEEKKASRLLGRQSATLSVTLPQAQLVAVAKTKGTLTPVLRNPGDVEVIDKAIETSASDILQSEKVAEIQGTKFSRGIKGDGNIEQVR